MPRIKDYLQLHFIVLLWGFTAILGKLITIPSVELVFYRTLLAALLLWLLLFWRKRKFDIGKQDMIKTGATGLLIAAHWILFFVSARIATISICLAGMSTITLWTSLLEPIITGKSIRWYEVVLGLIVISGLYIIFHFEFDHALGLLLAVLSALLAAVFTILNAGFTRKHNPYMITFYEMVGACLGTALFFPVYLTYLSGADTLQMMPLAIDWVYLLILALVCTVYAYSMSVELMKRISAFAVNLTINLEPVYGIILAMIIFGDQEQMTPGFYLGASIIVISILIHPVLNKHFSRETVGLDNLR
ncbi:MAG: DMT family transporter [Cyclobacteriaceae bacterium]